MSEMPPTLEVFQELSIVGTDDELDATKAAILAAAREAGPSWRPARDDELRRSGPDDDVITLMRAADKMAPDALLFLMRTSRSYRVTNIVPREVGELGRSRYNAILQEFVARFARAAAEQAGARLELSKAIESLEDFLGQAGAKALRAFSALANMSTGSSHPMDRRRWYEFIKTVADRDVDGAELGRWLQLLGWPEDEAGDLVSEFEFGHELVTYLRGG